MADSGPWRRRYPQHVSCRSASPRAILSRAAYQQVTPAAQRRADLRATPATLPGVPGRPTRASALSSATETTVACEKCRDKGTAQSIMLPMNVVPMIASFFMKFLSSVTCLPPILKTICLRWPRALRWSMALTNVTTWKLDRCAITPSTGSLKTSALASHSDRTPADGSAGLAHGGSGHAHTVNSCPTSAAGGSDLRDHAVRLRNRRRRHSLCRYCNR